MEGAISLFGHKFKVAVRGTFEGSTHIKNGVLLIPDAVEWLTKNGFFAIHPVSPIVDEFDEEEHEPDNVLVGLLKLLLG
jgi:hypothetical protein